jgi:hypothetical protein
MIRALVLVVFGVMILGTSCPGDFCDNSVNGTDFGFTLTIPSEFQCSTVFASANIIAQGRWYDSATQRIVSVVVKAPSTDQGQAEGYTIENLDPVTNGNGIAFEMKKVTLLDQSTGAGIVFNFIAAATLPSGNGLFITVAALTDDATLRPTLDTIVETVQLTP